MTNSYNSHHAAPGAYGTFTLGNFHTRGGFGVNDGRKPGDQQVYIGFTHDGKALTALPFFERLDSDATAAFTGESGDAEGRSLQAIPAESITRDCGWGSDTWQAPGIRFRIDSPFGPITEPGRGSAEALRRALLPAVTAELEWDNTRGQSEMTGFFAIGF
ncbi:MAG: glycoside hydrolase family 52 protein, partial [Chthoniobacteraceae bacterium]|nr:glycoside hydrolase family 52 protein [Chthoniobacteraceae bacterium]